MEIKEAYQKQFTEYKECRRILRMLLYRVKENEGIPFAVKSAEEFLNGVDNENLHDVDKRQLAINWWNTLKDGEKQKFVDKEIGVGRKFNTLTGREIEGIFLIVYKN